jgi:hypothetical protein
MPTHYSWISLGGKLLANKILVGKRFTYAQYWVSQQSSFVRIQTIARMHGTFDRHTTPTHVAQMAQAHKVYNHPQNTSKEKLY